MLLLMTSFTVLSLCLNSSRHCRCQSSPKMSFILQIYFCSCLSVFPYVCLIQSSNKYVFTESAFSFSPIEVQPGHTYGFMITAPHDIGDLGEIGFRWETDSHWYNPLTWSLLSHHSMHINFVDVVNGETDKR